MSPSRSRLPLLIALSLLTAGLAIVGPPPGLAEEGHNATVVRDEPEEHDPPRNLTLEGQVTNASSGEPVADLEIDIYNVWSSDDGERYGRDRLRAATDEAGRYSVNVSPGEVRMRIDDARYQGARTEFSIEDDLELDLPLEPVDPDRPRIHGTVTSEDGETIEGAHVRIAFSYDDCEERDDCERDHRPPRRQERETREVETEQGTVEIRYEPREDRYVSTQTDADGSYEVRVPAGPYEVSVRHEDYLSEDTKVEAQQGESVRANVSLTTIPPASVTVEGRVLDQATGDPIEGARVSLNNQAWGTRASTRTDGEGAFELSIQPGYTSLEIRAGETYYVPCEEPQEEGDGGDERAKARCEPRRERSTAYLPVSTTLRPDANETIEIEQALQPEPEPDTQIEGWVTNASSGEPIPNASLHVVNEETNEWGRAETGDDGSFRIAVNEGYYTVRVRAEGYFANATNLEVDDDGERITLELTPGQSRERGCCYVAHDGAIEEEAAASGTSREASADAGGSTSSGEETYQGGPGELGPPPSSASQQPTALQNVPTLGVLGLAGLLAGAAVAVGRRTR